MTIQLDVEETEAVEAAEPVVTPCEPNPAPEEVFPAQYDLDEANKLAKSAQFGIGQGKYQAPFSRQIRDATKVVFQKDSDMYALADEKMRKSLTHYMMLRVLTLGAFLGSMYLIASLVYGYRNTVGTSDVPMQFPKVWLHVIGNVGGLKLLGISLLVMLMLSGIRLALRHIFFYFIMNQARQAAFRLYSRHSEILSRITDQLSYAKRRVAETGSPNWQTRAKYYTKTALWNAKRSEFLDRYTTTVGWVVQNRMSMMEWVTNIISLSVLVWLSWLIITTGTETTIVEGQSGPSVFVQIGLLVIIWGVYVLNVLQRKQDDSWAKAFYEQISDKNQNEEHYYDKLANLVEDLVDEVLAKEYGGRGSDKV